MTQCHMGDVSRACLSRGAGLGVDTRENASGQGDIDALDGLGQRRYHGHGRTGNLCTFADQFARMLCLAGSLLNVLGDLMN